MQREIIEQKRKQSAAMGGAAGTNQDRTAQLSKQAKIIENRLDKANKRYNDAMTQNKVIREKIDEMRRERVVFEQVYLKLEKELGVKRRDLNRMIETVDKINEDRDQAINQIQAFQAAAQQASKNDDDEMRVEEFDEFDTQKAAVAKMAVRKTQTPLQRIQNALTGTIGAKLTADEIVTKFVAQEDAHFQLFNTVSQLKTEVANSENDIFDMQGKLEKLGRATDISAEGPDATHKAKAKRELDENMNVLEDEKIKVAGEIEQLDREMAQTMQTIKSLGLVTL